MTIKDLIDELKMYPDNAEVMSSDNSEIVHVSGDDDKVIISATMPIGRCKKCGELAFKELDSKLSKTYTGFCPACDENLFSFEINKY
jgi:formylmethanofuran dehydrogenase subunit E